MTKSINRRRFIKRGVIAGAGLGVLGNASTSRSAVGAGSQAGRATSAAMQEAGPAVLGARSPAETVVVAVMGVNSRGNELAKAFARSGAGVAYICDVDSRAV